MHNSFYKHWPIEIFRFKWQIEYNIYTKQLFVVKRRNWPRPASSILSSPGFFLDRQSTKSFSPLHKKTFFLQAACIAGVKKISPVTQLISFIWYIFSRIVPSYLKNSSIFCSPQSTEHIYIFLYHFRTENIWITFLKSLGIKLCYFSLLQFLIFSYTKYETPNFSLFPGKRPRPTHTKMPIFLLFCVARAWHARIIRLPPVDFFPFFMKLFWLRTHYKSSQYFSRRRHPAAFRFFSDRNTGVNWLLLSAARTGPLN